MANELFDNTISQFAWEYIDNFKSNSWTEANRVVLKNCSDSFFHTFFESDNITGATPDDRRGYTDPFLHLIHSKTIVKPSTKATEDNELNLDLFLNSLSENTDKWIEFIRFQLSAPTHTYNNKNVYEDYIFNQYASRVPTWEDDLQGTIGVIYKYDAYSKIQNIISDRLGHALDAFYANDQDRIRSENSLYTYLQKNNNLIERRDIALAFAYSWFVRGMTYKILAGEIISTGESAPYPKVNLHPLRNDAFFRDGFIREYCVTPPWGAIIPSLILDGAFDHSPGNVDRVALINFISHIREEYRSLSSKFSEMSRSWAGVSNSLGGITRRDLSKEKKKIVSNLLLTCGVKPDITTRTMSAAKFLTHISIAAVAGYHGKPGEFLPTTGTVLAGQAGINFLLKEGEIFKGKSKIIENIIKRNTDIRIYKEIKRMDINNKWFYHIFSYPSLGVWKD